MSTMPEKANIKSSVLEALLHRLDEAGVPMHTLLVARGDDIVLEASWSPMKFDGLHRMNSVTKSFVGVAVGCLIYEGRMSLTDRVIDYFPEAESFAVDPHQASLTVEDLLGMRTGYRPVGNTHWVRDKNYNRIKNFFEREPATHRGGEFYYDSTGSYILGVIVERLTGDCFVKYLQDRFLDEIGFSKNADCIRGPEGYSWSDSGLLCTARDLYLFAKFISGGGVVNGRRVISEEFLKKAISNIVPTGRPTKYNSYGYGYQIWHGPHGGYQFLGMGLQTLIYVPDRDLYIVSTADTQPCRDWLLKYFELCDELLIDGDIFTDVSADSPEAVAAYLSLEKYISELKLVSLSGDIPPADNKIVGREYIAGENPMGIERFRVDVDGAVGVFSYRNEQGDKAITFGIGHNEVTQFPEDGYYDMYIGFGPTGHRYPIAASGAWRDGGLDIFVQFIGRHLGGLEIRITPEDSGAKLTMKKSTNCFLDRYSGEVVGKQVL